ncbi:sensor histidine kinase [Streptomyces sp. NPDC088252]|uniref:sensor histidine kinase n=2 Tax=unclassified Streptomyces TaxID=2593676 RepID=UPI00380FBB77
MEREYPHRGPVWTEWLLSGGVLLLVAQGVMKAGLDTRPPAAGPVSAVVATLLLPLRWRRPPLVLAAAAVALIAQGAYEPMTVMVFHLSAQGRVRLAVAAGAVGGVLPWVCAAPLSGGVTPSYGAGLLFLLALTAGLWWHSRRRLIDSLSEQVELRAEQARSAERARIAAEMHDVLAHRLSLLALHTGVLALRADSMPPQVGERIALLRATSTQALADLRDVLGALRAKEDGSHRDGEDSGRRTVAAPAIRNLSELLDEVRAIGQEVMAEVTGDPGTTPATHLLAVHRLVQEGLTNARKHAPATAVRLRVHYGAPATEVELVNSPTTGPVRRSDEVAGPGYGLIGLGERVAGLHGRFVHGPEPDGGWRLAARLPLYAPAGEPERGQGGQWVTGPAGTRTGRTVGTGTGTGGGKGKGEATGMGMGMGKSSHKGMGKSVGRALVYRAGKLSVGRGGRLRTGAGR